MTDFPYVPVDARGWRLHMGLRPLDESRWLEVDGHRDHELALKRELLDSQRDLVFASHDQDDAASEELLAEIKENLRRFHPQIDVDSQVHDHPLVQAALLVQEDLCIIRHDEHWRLTSACVCFPSRWILAEKIGANLDEIHAPVPGYETSLATPTTMFFDRLSPSRSFWRLNWTLLDDATLHQPRAHRQAPSRDLEAWFLRVERQTLRRLSQTGVVVFTIRTYVASVRELLNEHVDLAQDLLARTVDGATGPATL